jgi:hypothetical protein
MGRPLSITCIDRSCAASKGTPRWYTWCAGTAPLVARTRGGEHRHQNESERTWSACSRTCCSPPSPRASSCRAMVWGLT